MSESETSRCCAPSWRLRSSRRRSTSLASTRRARERRSSSSWSFRSVMSMPQMSRRGSPRSSRSGVVDQVTGAARRSVVIQVSSNSPRPPSATTSSIAARTVLALLGRDEDVPEGVAAGEVVVPAAREPLERRVEANDVAAGSDEAEQAGRRVDDGADEVALVLEVAVALLELGVQALELGLGAVAVGELAPDQHGLVAGLDDPGLEVPGLPVELERVLAGDDLARVDRALDPADELVGDVARQDVVRLGADQLVGRHGKVLGLALVLEVDALAVHAEDQVGEGVDQRLDARLSLRQRGQAALVLERERGRRGHRLDEERVLLQRAVVDERGHRVAVALDHGRELLAAPLRQLDRLAVQVGEGLGLGDPVGQAQGRVAERACERLPQLAGRVRLSQLEDQLAHALPRQAAAEQTEDEREQGRWRR